MGEIAIYNLEKAKIGSAELPVSFGQKANRALLYQVVTAQQTNQRQGTAKVKNRHEVVGSTRKIYRQKGTGRARHGDIKAPLFVGGGRVFGPKPRDYEVRLPQKIRQAALRSAIVDRQSEGRFWILDGLSFDEPKTKKAAAVFSKFEIDGALVVLDQKAPATEKSIRNLRGFKVCRVEALSVLEILRHKHLVLTKGSFEKVKTALGGPT